YLRIAAQVDPNPGPHITLDRLRQSRLGSDLVRLAQIAAGTQHARRDEILAAIDSVLQLLFWPVGAEDYQVPRSFWERPLGGMLSEAKRRAYTREELLSVDEAATHFGFRDRRVVYRMMDEGKIGYVRDPTGG